MEAKNYNDFTYNLENFLVQWDSDYTSQLEKLPLFDINWVSNWNHEQKQFFIKVFYHLRGHFHEFSWFLANHANDKVTKDIVLHNIKEELNGSAASHEQMYFYFAQSLEVNIMEEYIDESHYLDFAKDFNKGHIKWLSDHDPEERFAAFAAYERLDNVDYEYLYRLADNIGVTRKGLLFFKVHTAVEHFESTESKLNKVWEQDYNKVINGFNFIASHQIKMWKNLSDSIKSL